MYHIPVKLNESWLDMTCSYLLHVEICHHCSWYCVNIFCLVTLIKLVRYLTSSLARTVVSKPWLVSHSVD